MKYLLVLSSSFMPALFVVCASVGGIRCELVVCESLSQDLEGCVRVADSMEWESSIPPGFRFHPTEEELVGYYLARKINSLTSDLNIISYIDLYKMEPWDIEDRCKMGYEEQSEWYFFSHKDKKYPTGTRTNRATAAGFWKATGRDKAVVSGNKLIGMRKTLVFYCGRAPNGRKTDWIVHEYRLQSSEIAPPQDEGWVVCRAFKKPSPNQRPGYEAWNHPYYPRDPPNSSIRNPWRQPLLSPSITNSAKHLDHSQAGETSANRQPHVDGTVFQDRELFSDHHLQLTEVLPQLDSPLSVAYNDEDYCDDVGVPNINTESGSIGEFFDWKNLDSMAPHSNNINATTSVGSSSNNSCFLGFFLDS